MFFLDEATDRSRKTVIRALLKKRFEKIFEPEILAKGMELSGRWKAVGKLVPVELVAQDGWLTIAWNRQPASKPAAVAAVRGTSGSPLEDRHSCLLLDGWLAFALKTPMAAKIYYDNDADLSLLSGKTRGFSGRRIAWLRGRAGRSGRFFAPKDVLAGLRRAHDPFRAQAGWQRK